MQGLDGKGWEDGCARARGGRARFGRAADARGHLWWKRGALTEGKRPSYLPITMWSVTCPPGPMELPGVTGASSAPAASRLPWNSHSPPGVRLFCAKQWGWLVPHLGPHTGSPHVAAHVPWLTKGARSAATAQASLCSEDACPHVSPCRCTWCNCPPPTSRSPRRTGRPASKRTCSSSWAGRR